MALKAGSCAAERYESRQVREEAAVNSSFWVPQEYLARAGWFEQAAERDQEQVHSLFLLLTPVTASIICLCESYYSVFARIFIPSEAIATE